MTSDVLLPIRRDALGRVTFVSRLKKSRQQKKDGYGPRLETHTTYPLIRKKSDGQNDEDVLTITSYVGVVQRPSVTNVNTDDETITRIVQVHASKVTTHVAISSLVVHPQSRPPLPAPPSSQTRRPQAAVAGPATSHHPTATTINSAYAAHKPDISSSDSSRGNNKSFSAPSKVMSNSVIVSNSPLTNIPSTSIKYGVSDQQQQYKTIVQTLTKLETRTISPTSTKSHDSTNDGRDEAESIRNTRHGIKTRTSTNIENEEKTSTQKTETIQVMTPMSPGALLQAVTDATRVGRGKSQGVRRGDKQTKVTGLAALLWLLIILFMMNWF